MWKLTFIYFLFQSSRHVYSKDQYTFLHPCEVADGDCQKELWQKAIPYFVKGLPQIGIAPMDPMKIDYLKIEVPNIAEVHFRGGVMKGFKTCVMDGVKSDVYKDKVNATIELNCDITIRGHVNLTSDTSVIPGLISEDFLRVDGLTKVKLWFRSQMAKTEPLWIRHVCQPLFSETIRTILLKLVNLKLAFFTHFKAVKDTNGETVLDLRTPFGYKYKFGGPVSFSTNRITLADQDITDFVVNFVNTNWLYIMDNFSAPFFAKVMEIVGETMKKFFGGVPAKEYFADELIIK